MGNLQVKLAVMGPGMVKWSFKIYFQVYLSVWHERPAFIVSAEMCSLRLAFVLFPTLPFEIWFLFLTIFYHELSVPSKMSSQALPALLPGHSLVQKHHIFFCPVA